MKTQSRRGRERQVGAAREGSGQGPTCGGSRCRSPLTALPRKGHGLAGLDSPSHPRVLRRCEVRGPGAEGPVTLEAFAWGEGSTGARDLGRWRRSAPSPAAQRSGRGPRPQGGSEERPPGARRRLRRVRGAPGIPASRGRAPRAAGEGLGWGAVPG